MQGPLKQAGVFPDDLNALPRRSEQFQSRDIPVKCPNGLHWALDSRFKDHLRHVVFYETGPQ